MIYHEPDGQPGKPVIVDPKDPTRRTAIDPAMRSEDLMVPVFRGGACVHAAPPLADVRKRTADQLSQLHPTIRRLLNPHEYPVGLEQSLAERRMNTLHKGAPGRLMPGHRQGCFSNPETRSGPQGC